MRSVLPRLFDRHLTLPGSLLKALGLDGREAFYKPYGQKTQKVLLDLAHKHGLIPCCGSDFHGHERMTQSDPALQDSPFNYGPAHGRTNGPGVLMPGDYWNAFLDAVS